MKQRINSLTSLRFIAAALLVVHHSRGLSRRVDELLGPIALDHGVSFFFVLSGFILTYVYSTLNTREEVGRFFLARFARIWPAHFMSFLLVICLFPLNQWNMIQPGTDNLYLVALTNLFMVHAWIPSNYYYFSFNGVSWSISTEFFFYLCFPVLIYQWKENWLLKFIAASLLLLLIIYLCNVVNLPGYSAKYRGVTLHSLVFISPIGRIFEFILGMVIALFWEKNINRFHLSRATATVLEVITIILIIISLKYSSLLAYHYMSGFLGEAGIEWFKHSGSCFIFALLIFVIATGKGYFSKLLSYRLPVLLGEISFSIYLIHQIIIRYYNGHFSSLSNLIPPLLIYCILWIIILSLSYIMWYFIERPSRKFIVGLWPKKALLNEEIV